MLYIKQGLTTDCVVRPQTIIIEDQYLQKKFQTPYKAYLDCGYEKDLKTTKEAIELLYPDYQESYERAFEKAAGNYPANMIIAKKNLFDEYCQWLFSLLEYVEERTDLQDYSQQEARVFGYISERLLGVWLDKNKLKVKEVRIVNTEYKMGISDYCIEFLRGIGVYSTIKKVIFFLQKGHSK